MSNKYETWTIRPVQLDISDCWVDVEPGKITNAAYAGYQQAVLRQIALKAKVHPMELPPIDIVVALNPGGMLRRFKPAQRTVTVIMQVED